MRSGDPRIYIVPVTEIENSTENSFLDRITPIFEKWIKKWYNKRKNEFKFSFEKLKRKMKWKEDGYGL